MNSNPYSQNFESSSHQQNISNTNTNVVNENENNKQLLRSIPRTGLNLNNNANNGPDTYKPKKIPENIKENIIKELKKISNVIYNGKIDSCRQHSVEALLYFKQIFPDN